MLIDTPSIVKGSAKGTFLGLPDISKLRDVDVLLIVVRGFVSDDITYLGSDEINPVDEYFRLAQELMQKDLETIDSALYQVELACSLNKGGRLKAFEAWTLKKAWEWLFGKKKPEFKKVAGGYRFIPDYCYGKPLKANTWDNNELEALANYNLWTTKETVILLNVNRRDYLSKRSVWVEPLRRSINSFEGTSATSIITVSVEFEDLLRRQIRDTAMEIYKKDKSRSFQETKKAVLAEHLAANPIQCSTMESVISESLKAIQVIHFHTFTNRDSKVLSEFKSWTIRQGTSTSEAAGIIDTIMHR